MNMASNMEGQTRRAKGQLGLDVHGNPLLRLFFLMSRLRTKLAFYAFQRNDTQPELSLPNLRFGELGE